jgi:dTDP-glucose 4,6-dehydratase
MASHTPARVLVTGGAGFIGASFVRHLIEADPAVRVVNLDLLTYAGSLDNVAGLDEARHLFVKGDITDAPLVEGLLREHRIDTVVHFAAESHVDRSIDGPAAFVRTNVVGTFTLLEAARRVWLDGGRREGVRFHHVSTDEVYGSLRRGDPPFHEGTPYAPNSPYSASKAGSDHLARAYHHTYGLPVTQTNCSNNYGPLQHPEKFIPTVIRACLMGRPIPIYGDGMNIRDWLYVADHCRGIDAVIRRGRPGAVYNIGGCNEWANLDIARLVCRLFDERRPEGAPHDRLVSFVKDRPGHDFRYAIDAARMKDELGWTPEETFETGIAKTIDWYLGAPGRAGETAR